MYLDGGKILGEDRANYKLRYFYDVTGIKIIRLIKDNTYCNYECIKDSQGSIVALINLQNNVLAAQYEYDALGKCTVLVNDDEMAIMNAFRWKGFFYDSESGFYYANGSYYDPDTGMYVDAAPVSTVIENADTPRYIDRNGTLCYNYLAIAGSPYTALPTVEMVEDPSYNPGKTWWEKISGQITSWWRSIPKHVKIISGIVLIAAAIGIACIPGGAEAEAQIAKILIEVAIGVGTAVVGWAISSAISGKWNTDELEETLADALFITGVFVFISTCVSTIKYVSRANANPAQELAECAGYCFIAGTLVHCEDGTKNIEAVQVGDKVLAYNEETGEQAYKTVVRLFRNESKDWVGVKVNDKEIVSTPGHKYYLPLTKQWVSAQDLKAGDTVLLSDGQLAQIQATRSIHYETPQTTYNFEVEDFHTYYVETGVLVHNKNCETKLYRAMSDAEYGSLTKHGRFKHKLGTMQDKFMATSIDDAVTWGNKMMGSGNFNVVEIRVATSSLKGMQYYNYALDGIGKAYSAHYTYLNKVMLGFRRIL